MHLGRRAAALALATSVGTTLLTLVPGAPAQAAVSGVTVLGPLVTLKAEDATPAGAATEVHRCLLQQGPVVGRWKESAVRRLARA